MEKNDNIQSPPSTGETPASTTGSTPSTALGNAGFLQSIQQRFDSIGDDAGK
jgi:hypothetical protein